jgi:hypothetical protein
MPWGVNHCSRFAANLKTAGYNVTDRDTAVQVMKRRTSSRGIASKTPTQSISNHAALRVRSCFAVAAIGRGWGISGCFRLRNFRFASA